jgi:hypothetical protein
MRRARAGVAGKVVVDTKTNNLMRKRCAEEVRKPVAEGKVGGDDLSLVVSKNGPRLIQC